MARRQALPRLKSADLCLEDSDERVQEFLGHMSTQVYKKTKKTTKTTKEPNSDPEEHSLQ